MSQRKLKFERDRFCCLKKKNLLNIHKGEIDAEEGKSDHEGGGTPWIVLFFCRLGLSAKYEIRFAEC